MKKFTPKRRLPSKLSALARLALVDLISIRDTKAKNGMTYRINMTEWNTPHPPMNTCYVCYAGSMLARCGFNPSRKFNSIDLPKPVRRKMFALNQLRGGHVRQAVLELRPKSTREELDHAEKLNRIVFEYRLNPSSFINDMSRLIIDLEVAGL